MDLAHMSTVSLIFSERGTSLAESGIQTFKMSGHRHHAPDAFEINSAATACLSYAKSVLVRPLGLWRSLSKWI